MSIIVDPSNSSLGDYRDTLDTLKEKGLLVQKSTLWHIFNCPRILETNEKVLFGIRYFIYEHQKKLLELFKNNSFEEILDIPVGPFQRCGTQLTFRYTKSGSLVVIRIVECHLNEGRYMKLTPTKIFSGDDGKKIIETIKKLDQSVGGSKIL